MTFLEPEKCCEPAVGGGLRYEGRNALIFHRGHGHKDQKGAASIHQVNDDDDDEGNCFKISSMFLLIGYYGGE